MAPTRERRGRLALRSIGTVVVGVMLCAGTTAAAQTRATDKRRTLKPEHRTGGWQERVPVSGGIRVGVVVWQPGKFNPRELALTLPKEDVRVGETDGKRREPLNRLCVEISSRDGRYSALLEYRIEKEAAGPVTAEVDTNGLDKLNAVGGEDVAILAGLSADCRSRSPFVYLVAAWSPPKPGDTITILLNSRVPTTILGPDASVPCRELADVTTAYNLRCDLPANLEKEKVDLVIRQKRGRSQADVPLRLLLAR
jgi:hypothetical protein